MAAPMAGAVPGENNGGSPGSPRAGGAGAAPELSLSSLSSQGPGRGRTEPGAPGAGTGHGEFGIAWE